LQTEIFQQLIKATSAMQMEKKYSFYDQGRIYAIFGSETLDEFFDSGFLSNVWHDFNKRLDMKLL
jgi:hypothetical protein